MSNTARRYDAVSLTPPAAAGLRRLTAQLTAQLERRVTLSEVQAALLKLAEENPERFTYTLARLR